MSDVGVVERPDKSGREFMPGHHPGAQQELPGAKSFLPPECRRSGPDAKENRTHSGLP